MTNNTNIEAYFDDIGSNMLRFFDGWDDHIPHQGEKGGIRERRVSDFLKSHLPRKYGVGTGHIIDREGTMSLQEDIVLFDANNSPTLRIDDYYQIFPCETVYATVEVKSTLDTQAIDACIEHTKRLHELNRGELGPIESFVFAYDSYSSKEHPPAVWAGGNFKLISEARGTTRPMPSAILSLRHNFVLYFGLDTNKHIAQGTDKAILLFYFTVLLNRLENVETESPLLFHRYGWSKNNPLIVYQYSINKNDKNQNKD